MPSFREFGAVPYAGGTRFCLWAFGCHHADVHIEHTGNFALAASGDGFFEVDIAGVGVGARYWFSLDGGPRLPDLASRWQPEGIEGPSVVVAPAFAWTDADWAGVKRHDQVIQEIHIGTFTAEGTWKAATERLGALREVGITVLQVMPVGAFHGQFGWGYDTTHLYAPFAPYGSPDAMRGFIDRAHGLGIGVILDVVYNHAGLGDTYAAYSPHYFTNVHENEWGASFNYDGDGAKAVRDFIIGNAIYWITDFHLDGLRIDAAQAMVDHSGHHIIAELTEAVRRASGSRECYIVVENQPQDRRMIEPTEQGGMGADAMISDDFQHAARVAMTGHNDFYYRDYMGTPQELVSALKYGFLYQGQRSDMRDAAYGSDNLTTPPERFVHFLENHDQVANSARGFRLGALATPARVRAVTAMFLLGPQTPCLFQGQEFGASNPFLYFFDVQGEFGKAVADGRRASLTNFPSVADPVMQDGLPLPSDPATFVTSKLDWAEAERNAPIMRLHQDLLAMRGKLAAFRQSGDRRIDGAVIGAAALLVRYLTPEPSDQRLLLVNLGRDLPIGVLAEPLMAPPRGHRWVVEWSSEHPDYSGTGRRPIDPTSFWILPADCALVFASVPRDAVVDQG